MRQFNVAMGDAEAEALEWLQGWVRARFAIVDGARERHMMRECHDALSTLFSGEIPVTTDQGTHGGAHGPARATARGDQGKDAAAHGVQEDDGS